MLLPHDFSDYMWNFSWLFSVLAMIYILKPYKASYYKKYRGNDVFCFLGALKIVVPKDPKALPTVIANGKTTYLAQIPRNSDVSKLTIDKTHSISQFFTGVLSTGETVHGSISTGESYLETVGYKIQFTIHRCRADAEITTEKVKRKATLRQAEAVDKLWAQLITLLSQRQAAD